MVQGYSIAWALVWLVVLVFLIEMMLIFLFATFSIRYFIPHYLYKHSIDSIEFPRSCMTCMVACKHKENIIIYTLGQEVTNFGIFGDSNNILIIELIWKSLQPTYDNNDTTFLSSIVGASNGIPLPSLFYFKIASRLLKLLLQLISQISHNSKIWHLILMWLKKVVYIEKAFCCHLQILIFNIERHPLHNIKQTKPISCRLCKQSLSFSHCEGAWYCFHNLQHVTY